MCKVSRMYCALDLRIAWHEWRYLSPLLTRTPGRVSQFQIRIFRLRSILLPPPQPPPFSLCNLKSPPPFFLLLHRRAGADGRMDMDFAPTTHKFPILTHYQEEGNGGEEDNTKTYSSFHFAYTCECLPSSSSFLSLGGGGGKEEEVKEP